MARVREILLPWDQQPQEVIRPAQRWLDRGLQYARISPHYEAVNSEATAFVSNGAGRLGLLFRGQDTYRASADVAPCTVIGHHYITSDNHDYGGIGWGYFSGVGYHLTTSYDSGILYLVNRYGGSGVTNGETGITLPYEATWALRGTLGSGGSADAFKNGVYATSVPQSGGTGFSTNSAKKFDVFTASSTGKSSSFAFKFGSLLTDAEIRELSLNPWAIAEQSIPVPVAAGGGSVSGTVAYTNANDTSSASGTTTVTGTLAKSNTSDTSAANGTTTVLGASSATNAHDTAAASGSVGSSGSTGTVNVTNANDTSAAAGTATVTGTVARSNVDDSVSATGWAGLISGTVNAANANDTVSASGNVGQPTIATGGGWFPNVRRRTKKEIDDERRKLGILPPEVVEAVAAVKPERRKITLAQLIGKTEAAKITSVDLSEAIAMSKRRKRQRDDEYLMMM